MAEVIQKIFLLTLTLVWVAACSKSDPLRLPSLLSPKNISKNEIKTTTSADTLERMGCTSSKGDVLDFCSSNIPVTCEKKSRGEYCTQYTDQQTARMWGPF